MFTASNLLKRGANYLLVVLLARSVSVSIIGTYSAYINIIGVVLLLTNFGFSEFILVNSKNENELKENVKKFLQISLAIFFLFVLGTLILPTIDKGLATLILVKLYLETNIYNIFLAYYQVKKKIVIITISNIILGTLTAIVSYLFYWLNKDIYSYLLGVNVLYILIMLFHFVYIKFIFSSLNDIVVFVKKRFSDLKYYGISMVTIPIYMMAPTVIGSLLVPVDKLAYYQIAFSISNILLLVSVSLLQVGYVKFLEYQDNFQELKKALKKTGIKIIIVNVMFFLLFAVFGQEILLLVYKKQEYANAYIPLLILLLGNVIFMFASIAAVVMVILKLQKEKAKYHIEFIVISILCGLLLTYLYGVYGIATSYVVLYSYSTFRYIKRFLEIDASLA